ncbi:hypothetical protein [Dokdonia sp. Asnod2-E02]|uniref:hypothetical protein n=1 Tax=Dokdonia sp. Asnod2-E02 TaxID=3160574 RepID=UPI00386F5883
MKKILYILTILVFGVTYAQETKTSDCSLQVENKVWKREFEKAESKSERIELIKAKIKADSIYKQSDIKIKTAHSPTIINEHENQYGTECGCKILFVLHYKNRRAIIVNLNEKPELSVVIDKLNSENVAQIWSEFKEEIAGTVYGVAGKCGFVQMKITDRKLKRLIKNVW